MNISKPPEDAPKKHRIVYVPMYSSSAYQCLDCFDLRKFPQEIESKPCEPKHG